MKILVNVTQACIDAGTPCENYPCPIALAIKSQNLSFVYVAVSAIEVTCYIDKKFHCAKLPSEAQVFVEKFDSEETVQPFSFELEFSA